MTTERGQIARVLKLIRKHGNTLLERVLERCQHDLATQGKRDQVVLLTRALGINLEQMLTELVADDSRINQWTEQVERNNARDKLICTVFNDLTKQAQAVVMQGPEAQIRYFANRYGMDRAKKLVENLIKPN